MPKVVNLMREKLNRTRGELSKTLRKLKEGKADREMVRGQSALTRTLTKRARERRQVEKRPAPRLTVVPPKTRED